VHISARITVFLMLAAATLTLGASEEAKNKKEAGKVTFEETCTMCHKVTGEDGIGPGLAALKSGKLPRSGKEVNRENLRELLENGRPKADPEMPPFADVLTKDEREAVIDYLLSL